MEYRKRYYDNNDNNICTYVRCRTARRRDRVCRGGGGRAKAAAEAIGGGPRHRICQLPKAKHSIYVFTTDTVMGHHRRRVIVAVDAAAAAAWAASNVAGDDNE